MYAPRLSNVAFFVACAASAAIAAEAPVSPARTVRIAAAQPRARLIDWHNTNPKDVLAKVDQSLGELETLVDRAAARHCDVIALPEDTLGLGHWLAGNDGLSREVLPEAVRHMLARFGVAAAKHRMYVVCCNNSAGSNGAVYNTAFLLGRDGKEIGRYRKVCPTIHERYCTPGDKLPVFDTKDLGGVGMLICYDMVFPETARALALAGADIIFHPTLGGAAIGDGDMSRAAFRTRAVENFVYLVVAQRGAGSMIISPQGKIIAEAQGPDSLAIADIDPFGGREGGDAMNHQRDMRARLFRERNPAAFGILADPHPPALARLPATITEQEAVRMAQRVLTVGEEEFKAAAALASQGKTEEAIAAFNRLRREYRDSWIDRVAAERLARLEPLAKPQSQNRDAGQAGKPYRAQTRVEIVDGRWRLNGKLTYPGAKAEGLLMNVRMVNSVFEDAKRKDFDPEANTAKFLAAVPDYVAHGVRAFTIGLQGGFPGYEGAVNSAFAPDGSLRSGYPERVAKVIEACDRRGAAVILGCYYQRQDQILRDEAAVRAGVVNVANWVRSRGYTNVLLEIANEYPHEGFDHRVLRSAEGEAGLIELARRTAPRLLVSTSGIGDGKLADAVARASDFLLIHFNGVPVREIPGRIEAVRKYGKPIVCNEDDKPSRASAEAAEASVAAGASWGLMLEKVNQHAPFSFRGADDDPLVYAALRKLTNP